MERPQDIREKRIDTAVALKEPDRVPFVPKTSGFYYMNYGITSYDAMKDARNMIPGIRQYLRDFDPDAINLGGLYGIDSLETLGTDFLRWPGPECDLPLDSSFQHLDKEYLHDEELDEYILDPTHTMMTKILPRMHKNLRGLSKLYLREAYNSGFFADLSAFSDPEVRETLFTLMKAGDLAATRAKQMAEVKKAISEEGYNTYCQGTFFLPFDAYADSIRGILRACMDMIEYPEELHMIVDKLTEMNVERLLRVYQSQGAKRIFIPMHCGVDDFMSVENYKEFYWPNLRKCIDLVIKYNMTPVCFCEGRYNSRLDIIGDVPKGKVIYQFEKVDLKKAKEVVGKNACIAAAIPNTLLAFGTKEQVIEETKRQLDILAPGGGCIMDCSLMLDNAKHENVMAWKEATIKYGNY